MTDSQYRIELLNEMSLESPKETAWIHATLSMKPAENMTNATMLIESASTPPVASLREFTATAAPVPMPPAVSPKLITVRENLRSVHPEAVPYRPELRPRTGAGRLEASEAT
jgi:hypothetical protein